MNVELNTIVIDFVINVLSPLYTLFNVILIIVHVQDLHRNIVILPRPEYPCIGHFITILEEPSPNQKSKSNQIKLYFHKNKYKNKHKTQKILLSYDSHQFTSFNHLLLSCSFCKKTFTPFSRRYRGILECCFEYYL